MPYPDDSLGNFNKWLFTIIHKHHVHYCLPFGTDILCYTQACTYMNMQTRISFNKLFSIVIRSYTVPTQYFLEKLLKTAKAILLSARSTGHGSNPRPCSTKHNSEQVVYISASVTKQYNWYHSLLMRLCHQF